MKDMPLTKEEILDAAEIALRKFGPEKMGVVDVAKILEISHGTIYRHFKSKSELQAAITERWLGRVYDPLNRVMNQSIGAREKLSKWFKAYIVEKRKRVVDDFELFETYQMLIRRNDAVLERHKQTLMSNIEQIVAEGIRCGEFKPLDPAVLAKTIFLATAYFRHPVHMGEWKTTEEVLFELDAVLEMIFKGIEM